MRRFVIYVSLAWLILLALTACTVSQPVLRFSSPVQSAQATATLSPPTLTLTPFQPQAPDTPIPTITSTTSPTATGTPAPTETPSPTPSETPTTEPANELPPSAYVSGMHGFAQSYSLDCESRSAVDWAAYFGIAINHQDFLDALPRSDNPETGFVGSYYDNIGQIPPYSYGVHAQPVASLLSAYGAPADAVKGATWQDLKAEIAQGRPVIVWIINGLSAGTPIEYTASDGSTTIVAPNEHTVILVGYEENWVTVLDGNLLYGSTLQRFLDSWSVLGNMAIIAAD